MTASIHVLCTYSRSKLPSGAETPRASLRGLHDPLRSEAEVIRLRDRMQAQLPADVEPTGGSAA